MNLAGQPRRDAERLWGGAGSKRERSRRRTSKTRETRRGSGDRSRVGEVGKGGAEYGVGVGSGAGVVWTVLVVNGPLTRSLAVERLRPAPARVRRTGGTRGCPRSLRRPARPVDEVPINGDGFRLTLRVGDYERAVTGEVWDDNWLRGSVDIEIAQPRTATFRAKCDVAWQTTELQGVYESLRTLLEDLTGAVNLTTIEDH